LQKFRAADSVGQLCGQLSGAL